MKKFAVILSGSGVYDGAEIHEATLTLLAIAKAGAVYEIFAPDTFQFHVVNHYTGSEMHEKRNVLVESARIARGVIRPTSAFDAADFDALIFPGGFGAAKNLSSWAIEGDACKVHPEVAAAVTAMVEAGKPIGAMCIAPVILAQLIKGTNLTTGRDKSSADFIEKMGSGYTPAGHGEVIIDNVMKIFSTPCYMLDATIVQIEEGTRNIVTEMMKIM